MTRINPPLPNACAPCDEIVSGIRRKKPPGGKPKARDRRLRTSKPAASLRARSTSPNVKARRLPLRVLARPRNGQRFRSGVQ
jgi:hypothetical protein